MRVLVLNGSPQKKSDTKRLTESFLKGLNKNSELETPMIPKEAYIRSVNGQ